MGNKRVDILSDEGRKKLMHMDKKTLVDLVQDVTIIYRLRFAILEAWGVNYKEILGLHDEDEE